MSKPLASLSELGPEPPYWDGPLLTLMKQNADGYYDEQQFPTVIATWAQWQKQRADDLESRLRVAVETLQKMSRDDKPRPSAGWMFQWAHDALTAIGPLPDKGDVSCGALS